MKKKASSTKGGTKKTKAKPAKKATKPLVISRAKIKDLRVSEAEAGRRGASTVGKPAGTALVEPHKSGANTRLARVEPHRSGANARLARVEPHTPGGNARLARVEPHRSPTA
jgi:hypothetical protein